MYTEVNLKVILVTVRIPPPLSIIILTNHTFDTGSRELICKHRNDPIDPKAHA